MYNIPVNAISKVQKNLFGHTIRVGDRIKILMNDQGYAALAINTTVRFAPHEYDLFIREQEYEDLLKNDH